MAQQLRFDNGNGHHGDGPRDSESEPTTQFLDAMRQLESIEGLSRGQVVQSIAMRVRADLMRALQAKDATPKSVAGQYRLHGDPSHHPEILGAAWTLEHTKPDEEPNGMLLATLEKLWKALRGSQRAAPDIGAMRTRLLQGEPPRTDNTDLDARQWEELLTGVEQPALRKAMETMRDTNLALRRKLDEHPKFKGILNPNAFERDLNASKEAGTFIFFDLISFKNFNSRYSYSFVDEMILRRICEALKKGLPAGSLVGIKGGDEFMIFVPGESRDTRTVNTMIAKIVETEMGSIPMADIEKGKALLPNKPKSLWRNFTNRIQKAVGRDPYDPKNIAKDLASVHGRVGVLKRESNMDMAEAERLAVGAMKSVDSWHYSANLRFPSATVERDGKISKPFSATGVEEKSWTRGVPNDMRYLLGKMFR